MPITFRVLHSGLNPERDEFQVVGMVDDGILVTGMIATAKGRRAPIQEIETVLDEDRGQIFRLTFAAPPADDRRQAVADWGEAWSEGTEVSLAY